MNNQEAFDKVAAHLRQQKGRAGEYRTVGERIVFHCAYLDDQGRKCAVGCLLDNYDAEMEDTTISTVFLNRFPQPSLEDVEVPLLKELQEVHDQLRHWDREDFNSVGEERLRQLAALYGLTYTAP